MPPPLQWWHAADAATAAAATAATATAATPAPTTASITPATTAVAAAYDAAATAASAAVQRGAPRYDLPAIDPFNERALALQPPARGHWQRLSALKVCRRTQACETSV